MSFAILSMIYFCLFLFGYTCRQCQPHNYIIMPDTSHTYGMSIHTTHAHNPGTSLNIRCDKSINGLC